MYIRDKDAVSEYENGNYRDRAGTLWVTIVITKPLPNNKHDWERLRDLPPGVLPVSWAEYLLDVPFNEDLDEIIENDIDDDAIDDEVWELLNCM